MASNLIYQELKVLDDSISKYSDDINASYNKIKDLMIDNNININSNYIEDSNLPFYYIKSNNSINKDNNIINIVNLIISTYNVHNLIDSLGIYMFFINNKLSIKEIYNNNLDCYDYSKYLIKYLNNKDYLYKYTSNNKIIDDIMNVIDNKESMGFVFELVSEYSKNERLSIINNLINIVENANYKVRLGYILDNYINFYSTGINLDNLKCNSSIENNTLIYIYLEK